MSTNALHRALVLTSWVAALFCLAVAGGMAWEHCANAANDPWKSPQLLALSEKLAMEPKSAALQNEIQRLDMIFRKNFRRRLAIDRSGAWLLVAGGLVMIVAARGAAHLHRALPAPQPKENMPDAATQQAARARWSVAGMAAVVLLSLALVCLGYPSVLPDDPAAWKKMLDTTELAASKPVEDVPALSEFQTNWPRFRGWDGSGGSGLKTSAAACGVIWKSAIPASGNSSPVVWGNHVFITGGTTGRREVFCYNAPGGGLVWRQPITNVPGSPAKIPEPPEDTGYATPTMAVDGRRVYALFANGDLAALKLDGSVVWTKYLGPIHNGYGYGTSLAVWQDRLFVQIDQGDSKPAGSKLISLQGESGQVLWERSRTVIESWATPIVVDAAGKVQIITLGDPWITAYTMTDGRELWRAQLLENEIVPSPVFAGGYVIAVSPGSRLLALRPDGTGDVTKTEVAWVNEENPPDITSPAANAEFVFTVTTPGVVTCFQTSNGKKVWEHDLNLETQASPAIAGGNLVVLGKNGTLVTMHASREFQETGRIQLQDKFVASPAFAGGHFFLRGMSNLYCLGPEGFKMAEKH